MKRLVSTCLGVALSVVFFVSTVSADTGARGKDASKRKTKDSYQIELQEKKAFEKARDEAYNTMWNMYHEVPMHDESEQIFWEYYDQMKYITDKNDFTSLINQCYWEIFDREEFLNARDEAYNTMWNMYHEVSMHDESEQIFWEYYDQMKYITDKDDFSSLINQCYGEIDATETFLIARDEAYNTMWNMYHEVSMHDESEDIFWAYYDQMKFITNQDDFSSLVNQCYWEIDANEAFLIARDEAYNTMWNMYYDEPMHEESEEIFWEYYDQMKYITDKNDFSSLINQCYWEIYDNEDFLIARDEAYNTMWTMYQEVPMHGDSEQIYWEYYDQMKFITEKNDFSSLIDMCYNEIYASETLQGYTL